MVHGCRRPPRERYGAAALVGLRPEHATATGRLFGGQRSASASPVRSRWNRRCGAGRAGVRAGRVHPGRRDQPAGRVEDPARAGLPVRGARLFRGRHLADRVAVMYLGSWSRSVRWTGVRGAVPPVHPALLSAIRSPDPAVERRRRAILLHGDLPNPATRPPAAGSAPRPLFVTLGRWPAAVRERDPLREPPPRVSADSGHEVAVTTRASGRSCELLVLVGCAARADRLRERGQACFRRPRRRAPTISNPRPRDQVAAGGDLRCDRRPADKLQPEHFWLPGGHGQGDQRIDALAVIGTADGGLRPDPTTGVGALTSTRRRCHLHAQPEGHWSDGVRSPGAIRASEGPQRLQPAFQVASKTVPGHRLGHRGSEDKQVVVTSPGVRGVAEPVQPALPGRTNADPAVFNTGWVNRIPTTPGRSRSSRSTRLRRR